MYLQSDLLCRECSVWLSPRGTISLNHGHAMGEGKALGRYAFSIGSNKIASLYAGIPVDFHITAVYAIGGALTGLAGMIEASRLMTGQPTAGQG